MQPGLVDGFADQAAGQRFDALWQNITKHHAYWCCAAELGQWSGFKYDVPKPLASECAAAWRAHAGGEAVQPAGLGSRGRAGGIMANSCLYACTLID